MSDHPKNTSVWNEQVDLTNTMESAKKRAADFRRIQEQVKREKELEAAAQETLKTAKEYYGNQNATIPLPPLGGTKYDNEKPRMDLLSSHWLRGVSDVLTFGAKKYASHNWRKGIARSRLIAAALRHITTYNEGEDYDSETGLLHLYHASCCLMFASELHFTRPDTDDRYIEPQRQDVISNSGN